MENRAAIPKPVFRGFWRAKGKEIQRNL